MSFSLRMLPCLLALLGCGLEAKPELFEPERVDCLVSDVPRNQGFIQQLPFSTIGGGGSKSDYYLKSSSEPTQIDFADQFLIFDPPSALVNFENANGVCIAAFYVRVLRILSMRERLQASTGTGFRFPDLPNIQRYWEDIQRDSMRSTSLKDTGFFVELSSENPFSSGISFVLFEGRVVAMDL